MANPTYEYISPGEFTVTLTVTDDDGATDSETVTITVSEPENEPPTAVISTSATSGTTPLSVDFTGDQSIDNDGSIVSYYWDFGENNRTSTLANPTYEYISPGEFTVTLTVTDDDGATDSDTTIVKVNNPTPKATFSNGTSISCESSGISGTVTIVGGPMTFRLGAYGGSGGTSITAVIDGIQISVTAPHGQSATSSDTQAFPPGQYNYTVSGSFAGCSGNGGSISAH
ncbi:PKD domain-containing protein [Pseudozobellia thermophila]|uniref:PKD domain-containing protein n=1 Tax=Pseudozobellia thermophila TaxID=192903 RepID=A0A1M6HGR8_9FLAO|nr:PKD domain-containing protein [Pseudozobellia thermophila]